MRNLMVLLLLLLFMTGCSDNIVLTPTATPGVTVTPTATPTPNPAAGWNVMTASNPPAPVYDHTMVEIGGKIYLWGGMSDSTSRISSSSGLSNNLALLDPNQPIWVKPTPSNNPPPARKGHNAGVYQDKMVIFGGIDPNGNYLNDIWLYDPLSNMWNQLTPSGTTPLGRANNPGSVVGDKLIVVGGESLGSILKDTWAYDFTTNTWEQKDDFPCVAAKLVGNKSVVNKNLGMIIPDFEQKNYWGIDPNSNAWKNAQGTGDFPSDRKLPLCTYSSTHAYIIGGIGLSGEVLKDAYRLNLDTLVMEKLADMPEARYSGSACYVQNYGIYVFGGKDGNHNNATTNYIYKEQ